MRQFTYATVCSGVEGCTLAINAGAPTAGAWRPVFFSEIGKFQSALLAYYYPDVPNLGDIQQISYEKDTKTVRGANGRVCLYERLDLLAGGTPCQDFSVAGLRQGGAEGSGTRSSLCWEFVRLVRELRPRVVLWENVAGCLSSGTPKGADFRAFVRALDDSGYCVAWRVLDCQFTRVDAWPLAIPQRRRRLWLVACADAGPADIAKILFESKSLLGDDPPCRESWQDYTGQAAQGPDTPKCIRERTGCAGGGKGPLIGDNLAHTLVAGNDLAIYTAGVQGYRESSFGEFVPTEGGGVSGPQAAQLTADQKQSLCMRAPMAIDSYNLTVTGAVVPTLTARGQDSSNGARIIQEQE